MKGFAKKVALVFALCLVCVSFAAAKGAAARKVVGTVSVSKTAAEDSSTTTANLKNGNISTVTASFDMGKVEYVYVKLDCTNGTNGKKATIEVNYKKLDGDFEYGKWWKIPSARKDGMIHIFAGGADNGGFTVNVK